MGMDTKEPLSAKDFIILGLYLCSFIVFTAGYIYLSKEGFSYLSAYGEKNAVSFFSGENVYFRIIYAVLAVFAPFITLYAYIKLSVKNDYKADLKKLTESLNKKKEEAYPELLAFSQDLVKYSEYEKLRNDILPLLKQICGQHKKTEYQKIADLLGEIQDIKPSYNPSNARASYFDYQTISKKQYKLSKLLENLKKEFIYI